MKHLPLTVAALFVCALLLLPGQAYANTIIVSPGDSIQDAIGNAGEDGFVILESGDHMLTENVTINFDGITIRGPNYGHSAGINPGNRWQDEAVIITGPYSITVEADNVTIDGLTIIGGVNTVDGAGKVSLINNIFMDIAGQAVTTTGSGIATRFIIRDSSFSGYQTALSLDGNINTLQASITGNIFENNSHAIETNPGLHSPFLEGEIKNNLISGNTLHGIRLAGGNFDIENNAIDGNSIGINLLGTGASLKGLVITGNNIANNSGSAIRLSAGPEDIDDIIIHENNIFGNQFGVNNLSGDILDARYNYWGHATGPSGNELDPVENVPADGVGDKVSADVRFSPFYTDAGRTQLGGAEFQVAVRIEIDGGGEVNIKENNEFAAVISGDGDFFTNNYDSRVGTELELTATAHSGYNLIRWDVDGEDKGNAAILNHTVTDNHNITAVFRGEELTVAEPEDVEGGEITVTPAEGPYYKGDVIHITAIPDAGWVFEQLMVTYDPFDENAFDETYNNFDVSITLNNNITMITAVFLKAPSPPENLNAQTTGDNQITLTWNNSDEPDNATYLVYSNTEGFDAQYSFSGEKKGDGSPAYEFVHTGLTTNVRYFYFVTTRDDDKNVESTQTSNRVSAVAGAPDEPVEHDEPVDLKPAEPAPFDPAAPVTRTPSRTADVSPSSGGDCFIATAAFGSYEAIEVIALRNFRDACLMSSKAGRGFVSLYYRVSPALSEAISGSGILRAAAKLHLAPVSLLAGLFN